VTIRTDDRDRETVAAGDVRPYDWKFGEKVACAFVGAGDWYPGCITALDGETIGIAYDDGDEENTPTGRCRSR